MASKHKCTYCKEYFPKDEMIKGNGASFCTKEHKNAHQKKRQQKDFKKSKERRAEAPSVEMEQVWFELIAQYVDKYGAFPLGLRNNPFQFHHIIGRKGRVLGKEWGRWLVLPIMTEWHDIKHGDNPENVTTFPKGYENAHGSQYMQFLTMCEAIKTEFGGLPFDEELIEAVRLMEGVE